MNLKTFGGWYSGIFRSYSGQTTGVARSKSGNSLFRTVGVATEIQTGHFPNISLRGSTAIVSMLYCMKFCPAFRYSNSQPKRRRAFKFIQRSQAWTTYDAPRPTAFEALKFRAVHRSHHSRGNLHSVHCLSNLFSNTTMLMCSHKNDIHRIYSRHRIRPPLIIS